MFGEFEILGWGVGGGLVLIAAYLIILLGIITSARTRKEIVKKSFKIAKNYLIKARGSYKFVSDTKNIT